MVAFIKGQSLSLLFFLACNCDQLLKLINSTSWSNSWTSTFLKGLVIQGSKQEVTKVIYLKKSQK